MVVFTTRKFSSRIISLYSIKLIFTIIWIAFAPNLSNSFHHNIKYSMNVVKTKYGPIRGVIVRTEPLVEAYLGVPYASPPVGSLRFMPPVTPSTWKNTRLADRFSPVCPQSVPVPPNGPEALLEIPRGRLAQLRRLLPLLANQSEDCLYLNLYVPRAFNPGSASPPSPTNFRVESTLSMGSSKPDGNTNSNTNSGTTFTNGGYIDLNDDPKNKPLPTIVYIHGESYEWNSGNPYDGSVLAAHGNVIVVTINFRLGILGFLKTGGKGSAQGNFGLMDLVAGLHWLRENLPAFGGDPNKVTIMGHGTGAALANILIVSPVASDLVHRAILLSGSALSPWAIQKDPIFVKRRVAEQTGCHGDLLVDDLAPCLRTKPIDQLLQVKIDSPRFLAGFAPFIDGTVIAHTSSGSTGPLTLPVGSAIASTSGIELADFPTRELIFGLTSIESYLDLSAQDLEFGFNETRRDRILRTYVRNVYHYHLNEIYAALKNEYTDWERPVRNPLGSRDASLEFLSDGHTASPLIRLGYLHSLRGGRTYFLHFRHQSGEREFPQRSGSVRGEDVPFCLGLPISQLFPYNYTKQDIKTSRIMIRYLSNFAQTGNPNETPATTVDISHLLHSSKSSLTSSSLTLGSSVLSLSQSAGISTVSADDKKNENFKEEEMKLLSTSKIIDGKSTSVTSPALRSTITKNIHNKNTQPEDFMINPSTTTLSGGEYDDTKVTKVITDNSRSSIDGGSNSGYLIPLLSTSLSSTLPFITPSLSSSPAINSIASSQSELSSSGVIKTENKNIMPSNHNNAIDIKTSIDKNNHINDGIVVNDLSLRTPFLNTKTKKLKRHIVALSDFSYATLENVSLDDDDDDDNDINIDLTIRSFKRRKRKILKQYTKRKNQPAYSGLLVTSSVGGGANSNINNNSIFYRKRYQLPIKQNDDSVKIEQRKPIRHNMQNDDPGIDDEDDEEDDENIIEEDDEEDDEDEAEYGRENRKNRNQRLDNSRDNDDEEVGEKFDRFSDDLIYSRLPFWDTYDAINQLYLDLGNKVEIRNHYRGHKLSMWLSLIPQLHSPGDLNELPMRHHHFPEDSAQYYDGIIRPQIMQRPNFPKPNVHQTQQIGPTTTTPRIDMSGLNIGGISATTTECPPNTTIVPTIAATRPQNNNQQQNNSSGNASGSTSPGVGKHDNNLLRRLASNQYQSYTTALIVTISVGCFLLLLNILIFAGIYYQREKRLTDAKKKEELRGEAERCATSPNLDKIGRTIVAGGSSSGKNGSRKSSLQSLTGYNSSGSFGEYSCYDEKLQCKEKHSLADICSVELPLKEFKCTSNVSPNASNTGSLRRTSNISPQQQQQTSGLLMYPPSYHNNSGNSNQQQQQHQNSHKSVHQQQQFPAAAVAIVEEQNCPTSVANPLVINSNNNSNNGLVTYSQFHKPPQQHIHFQHRQHHIHHSPASHSNAQFSHSGQQTHSHVSPPQKFQQSINNCTNVGTLTEQCNQSTQSDQTSVQDISTNIDEKNISVSTTSTQVTGSGLLMVPGTKHKLESNGNNNNVEDDEDEDDDDDNMISPGIPEPPPPPKSSVPYQGGILRQPGPPTTPGSNKKRVQIQEISV